MLKNILQNFVKKPATRPYPMVKREPFERYRGRLIGNVEECIFCRLCSNKCPSQCISTDPKEAYWGYDPFSCVYCGLCVDICPTKCLSLMDTHREPVTSRFVVYHKGVPRVARQKHAKDEMELKNDSSVDMPTPEGMPAVGANPEPEIVRITPKAQLKTQAAKPKPKPAPAQKPAESPKIAAPAKATAPEKPVESPKLVTPAKATAPEKPVESPKLVTPAKATAPEKPAEPLKAMPTKQTASTSKKKKKKK